MPTKREGNRQSRLYARIKHQAFKVFLTVGHTLLSLNKRAGLEASAQTEARIVTKTKESCCCNHCRLTYKLHSCESLPDECVTEDPLDLPRVPMEFVDPSLGILDIRDATGPAQISAIATSMYGL